MWKKLLVLSILVLIYPVIESKKRKSDSPKSTKCRRTNSKAFRYCTRPCSTDSDCKSPNSKCLCDGDCGLSCVKQNLKCDAPPNPKNSRQILSNKTYFGSVVTYSCSKPYNLRGSATRTCRAIRKWDGKKARCRIMCKDPGEIVFGNRRYEGSQAGKYIQYWCLDDKYKLVGSARITCLKSGQWSAPKPKCELPRCNPPAIPDTAEVFYPRKMPKKFQYSDIVVLKCKDGYFKVGIGTLKCKGDDNWEGGITCSPKSCGRPDHEFSHGKIIGYVYTFKQKVRYTCDEGYILDGPAYRQCQANEKWSGKDPTCKVVNCGPLNKPDHGDIIEKVAFTFGNRIVFECNTRGYEMKGSRIRTCRSDGTWSGSLTSCELVRCGDPGNPTNGKQVVKNGYVYGGSVTFVCDKDYTLEGTDTTYCQADKSWSAAVPQCLAPCLDPGDPYQGNRIGRNFRHDHTVRFTCPRDYIMEGVSVIKCTDGRWSNNKPSCKAPCDEPARPAHGGRRDRDFKHGRSVRFYCSHGYQRIGASSITCNDGTWNNRVPVCKGVCGRPRTPSNGQLHGNSFLDGDEVRFSCDKNHDLFGKAKLRCVGRVWNSAAPECKARCMFRGRPEHGFYKGSMARGDKIKHGVQITYSCLGGYTLVGDNMQECNDGRWTNNSPLCKATCRQPGDITNGFKIGDDYAHGKIVEYKCNRGYTLEGQNQLTCNDGSWNSKAPKCKAPCNEPANPAHGWKLGRDFKHGHSVRFYCSGGYQRIGALSITCNDGTWDNRFPVCKGFCGRLRAPSNGQFHGNSFLDGEEVTFSCDKNHDLFGKAILRCVGQAWDSAVPQCKARCTFRGRPEHGFYNGSMARGDKIKHGVQITYSCLGNYTLVGDNMQECNDGRWTNNSPLCKATCGQPSDITNGSKIGVNYAHGKTVQYKCNHGYTLEGQNQLTCNDGKWNSKPPICKASCQSPGGITNGFKIGDDYAHGKTVQYKCNHGYTLEDQNQLTCKDGKWNSKAPKCKASCNPIQAPHNGKIHNNNSEHRALVSFSCNGGFQLNGSRQIKCTNGKWNDSAPTCKENIAFSKHTFQSSTLVIRGHSLKSSYAVDGIKKTHHSQCTHTNDSTTTNPWWRVDLGRVETVAKVNILNRGDCCGKRLDGAEIRVGNEIKNGGATNHLCADKIQVPQGKSKTFLCRSNAHGRYVSIRIPGNNKYLTLCEVEVYSKNGRSSCKDLGQLRNGIIIGDDYTYGSTVEFRCNKHYRLHGSRFSSCVKGKWNASIPKCWKKCQNPGNPKNGWLLGNNFSHGGVVQFRCKNRTYELVGAFQITCNDGVWSDLIPSCEECGKSLGMENSNIQDFKITSPDFADVGHPPKNGRLNGPSSWCTTKQTFLQIDLGKTYQVTAIATQGGAGLDKWVKQYKIGFYAGATPLIYRESGQLQKTIEGNKDASSIVKYKFKEPFVTKKVQIYPEVDPTSTVCLRTEIYGCHPTPDCILVGTMFWGLWSQRDNSNNYYKAYITKINDTDIHFALETNKAKTRSYKRADPVLIIDKIPKMKDFSLNASVIAVHKPKMPEWYRTGIVNVIASRNFSVSVRFNDSQQRWVPLNELRLVKRPRFCGNNM